MLILILIDVQYSQKAVLSFEKGSNGQNHSSSGSHHPVKKIPPSKISDSTPNWGEPSHPLPLFGKPIWNAIWKKLYINYTTSIFQNF